MIYDLIVIGGGINGCGIATDAAGRGLSVALFEAADLASATSSASSKLIHGGLRYLEQYEFRLVKEALSEREVLLKLAPHIVKPMRFILPYEPHLRPAWMIRAGLFLYDHLSRLVTLQKSNSVKFDNFSPLKPNLEKGFEYSDCWVDDSRLVLINALEAKNKGALISTKTEVINAVRKGEIWQVFTKNHLTGEEKIWETKTLVNAAGPWVSEILDNVIQEKTHQHIRLVKGSHIIVPRLENHDKAYILQNKDNRIVFVIPWLNQFSIIGTTDINYNEDPRNVKISDDEIEYLLNICNEYFVKQLKKEEIIWSYSGVRPLYEERNKTNKSAQQITRDYHFEIEDQNGKAPLLSVFGGKLTTYRKLSEHALNKLKSYLPEMKQAWTENCILPGGDISVPRKEYFNSLLKDYPWLPENLAKRYAVTYGTLAHQFLKEKSSIQDLGQLLGYNLYDAELVYLIKNEWATELDDVIWRRTKLGIWLNKDEKQKIRARISELI